MGPLPTREYTLSAHIPDRERKASGQSWLPFTAKRRTLTFVITPRPSPAFPVDLTSKHLHAGRQRPQPCLGSVCSSGSKAPPPSPHLLRVPGRLSSTCISWLAVPRHAGTLPNAEPSLPGMPEVSGATSWTSWGRAWRGGCPATVCVVEKRGSAHC